jgi:hypothetical protein
MLLTVRSIAFKELQLLSGFLVVIHAYCVKTAISLSISFLSSPDRRWRILAEQLMFPPRFAPQSRPFIGANVIPAEYAKYNKSNSANVSAITLAQYERKTSAQSSYSHHHDAP